MGVSDTKKWKCFGARLISFERIAVIAREAASPAVLVCRKDCGLESEPFVDGLHVSGYGRC